MVKKQFSVLAVVLLFVLLSSFESGCKSNSPAAPAPTSVPTSAPTPTPVTVTVTGNVTMPALSAGKTMKVSFYKSPADLSSPVNSISVACTSNPMPYSLTVSADSYYVIAYVIGNINFPIPSAGDYLGVYGAIWPAWPASANAVVSAANTAFDLTLVTAANNLSGTMTIPADQTGKTFYVLLDPDTNGGNSNYAGFEMSTCPSGTSISYGMVVIVPGTYYLYGGVGVVASGTSGNYFGFYGVTSPYYVSPSAPNLTIDVSTPATKNFILSIMP